MNISELISAGFIGSVTTLAIKSVIDMLNAHNQYRRELKMQVFKRKTKYFKQMRKDNVTLLKIKWL